MDAYSRHQPLACPHCGASLGATDGVTLVVAPHLVIVSRVEVQCQCGRRQVWRPVLREVVALERWKRGRAVELIEA